MTLSIFWPFELRLMRILFSVQYPIFKLESEHACAPSLLFPFLRAQSAAPLGRVIQPVKRIILICDFTLKKCLSISYF